MTGVRWGRAAARPATRLSPGRERTSRDVGAGLSRVDGGPPWLQERLRHARDEGDKVRGARAIVYSIGASMISLSVLPCTTCSRTRRSVSVAGGDERLHDRSQPGGACSTPPVSSKDLPGRWFRMVLTMSLLPVILTSQPAAPARTAAAKASSSAAAVRSRPLTEEFDRPDRPADLDSRAVRQLQVQQHHVSLESQDLRRRPPRGARVADDLDVPGPGEQIVQTPPDDVVIVHQVHTVIPRDVALHAHRSTGERCSAPP